MLVLDAETLAKHYVKGSISRKQFVSLSASIAQIEEYANSKRFLAQLVKIFRCPSDLLIYTIKWRIKTVWRFIKYTFLTLLMVSAIVFWRIDTDELSSMWQSDFDVHHFTDLLIRGNPDPLPDDLRLATEYLSNTVIWERLHVKQYTNQWMQLDDREKDEIRKTNWFQEFSLLASIKKVELERRIITVILVMIRNCKSWMRWLIHYRDKAISRIIYSKTGVSE